MCSTNQQHTTNYNLCNPVCLFTCCKKACNPFFFVLVLPWVAGVCKHVYFAKFPHQPLDLGEADMLANPSTQWSAYICKDWLGLVCFPVQKTNAKTGWPRGSKGGFLIDLVKLDGFEGMIEGVFLLIVWAVENISKIFSKKRLKWQWNRSRIS